MTAIVDYDVVRRQADGCMFNATVPVWMYISRNSCRSCAMRWVESDGVQAQSPVMLLLTMILLFKQNSLVYLGGCQVDGGKQTISPAKSRNLEDAKFLGVRRFHWYDL